MQGTPGQRYSRWGSSIIITAPGTPVNILKTVNIFWRLILIPLRKMALQRVAAYIDGFNLYYGLRSKGWRRYYWLDLRRLVERLLRRGQQLVAVRYFTTAWCPNLAIGIKRGVRTPTWRLWRLSLT